MRAMDAAEYRAVLRALGLTQVEAARLREVSERMSRYYAHGDYPIPPSTAALLRLMVKTTTTAAELEAL